MCTIFRYYQAEEDVGNTNKDKHTFFIQCEWYTKNIDTKNTAADTKFCQLTITDGEHYWQCNVTNELIVGSFPDIPAFKLDAHDITLTFAFSGAHYEGVPNYSWAMKRKEDSDQLIMTFKTYLVDIAMKAGFFLVDKVEESKYKEIRKQWYNNQSVASHAALEADFAHSEEVMNDQHQINQLKTVVHDMTQETFEYKLTMFTNFSKVLNTKKNKIIELERTIEDLKRKVPKEFDDDEEEKIKVETVSFTHTRTTAKKCTTKKQKTSQIKSENSSPRPSPSQQEATSSIDLTQHSDEEDDQDNSSPANTTPISTNIPTPAQQTKNEYNDDSHDSDDGLFEMQMTL